MAQPGEQKVLMTPVAGEGRLAENIMHFARVLRRAGLPVGARQVLDAVDAVRAAGPGRRLDFYWTLHAVFVSSPDQRGLFDQAFHLFWRNPRLLERLRHLLLPGLRLDSAMPETETAAPRVMEALARSRPEPAGAADPPPEAVPQFDAAMTWSARAVETHRDFEKMTLAELAEAQAAARRIAPVLTPVLTRRFRPDAAHGVPDMRATLRAAARPGGEVATLRWRRRRHAPPPLVALCDISGSMDRYARIFLHFLHALANGPGQVHVFLFGVQLTNITRQLRHRDPDEAMNRISAAVGDWSGGTRIGAALRTFNRDWSRRVCARGAIALLITDGLDREGAAGLAAETARLRRSCRRLVWLNPLLRYDGYAPRAAGARAMMAHVDEFRPVHNLSSLAELAGALAGDIHQPRADMRRWRDLAA